MYEFNELFKQAIKSGKRLAAQLADIGAPATVVALVLILATALGLILGALKFMLPLLVGAYMGAVVGHFFDGTSRAFLDALGMQALEMWQLGAMLAFVGRFFRTNAETKVS